MTNDNNKKYGSNFLSRIKLGLKFKLIGIFLIENLLPIVLLFIIAWMQIGYLGTSLSAIAVFDSKKALNDRAVENIEHLTTDAALKVAGFLYARDNDVQYLARVTAREYERNNPANPVAFYGGITESYGDFVNLNTGKFVEPGEWGVSENGETWVPVGRKAPDYETGSTNTNNENNDENSYHYREPDNFTYIDLPLYDEIVFIDKNGFAQVQAKPDAPATGSQQFFAKNRYPLKDLTGAPVYMGEKNIYGNYTNSYVQAETYFDKLGSLGFGDIYVSDVIGAYIGSNHIGNYTKKVLEKLGKVYAPTSWAYAGKENPIGLRYEGIVRWITPVTDNGKSDGTIIGYVSLALNHSHIMELVDHITPMDNRYEELADAGGGNYAFIWDYQCRNIVHPRHHSVYGFDPETGYPQTPWLVQEDYNNWQAYSKQSEEKGTGIKLWFQYMKEKNIPAFHNQSRDYLGAAELTKAGLIGLDGRYLNHAPQCTGWMDLTKNGGSGSFYIRWTDLYKLTTAAAIPYYTGQYAPSNANEFSRRGFGFVTLSAEIDDFTKPATVTANALDSEISSNLADALISFLLAVVIIILVMALISVFVSTSITKSITGLVKGISRFRAGERHFRFNSEAKDEFGTLADSFDEMAESIEKSVKNPLSIIDMNHDIIYMNEKGLAVTGLSLTEIIGKPYGQNSIYPGRTIYDPITALESGKEAEIYHHTLTNSYYKGTANHLTDKAGNKVGYLIESIDMTEIVLDQIKKEEQRLLLDKVITASPDLIWYLNTNDRYVIVNPRFAAVAGRSANEIIGKKGSEVLPPSMAQEFLKSDEEAFSAQMPLYKEERIIFADNHEEFLESVRVPIFDTAGTLVGLLGYARNITARVQMENRLRQTQIDLEKAVISANLANNHKGDFLARMSHEIRTPMNAIIGITNIVLKKLSDESGNTDINELKQKMHQIEGSSQHLLGLLNDILDISKIEAGKIELAEEKMDLNDLAETVCTIIKPRCDDKTIRFISEIDNFGETAFLGDPLRLRQVLINLLGNSVKFTPEFGKITLEIKCLKRENGKSFISFAVTDTGIGISDDAKENIFRPFEQANKTVSTKYGGTGLGLAISSNIVKLLGGDIKVESTLGEGSSFSFCVWLTETEPEMKKSSSSETFSGKLTGKHILLVDDVEINRMIVCSLLEDTGAGITEADDGLTAIEAFEDSPENYFDIILMDVKMTHMDGYRATKMIREMDRADAKTIPIIALTANAFKDDIDAALQSGMNAHIAKPVEYDSLMKVLHRYL